MHPGAFRSCLIPFTDQILDWWYDDLLTAAEIQRRLKAGHAFHQSPRAASREAETPTGIEKEKRNFSGTSRDSSIPNSIIHSWNGGTPRI